MHAHVLSVIKYYGLTAYKKVYNKENSFLPYLYIQQIFWATEQKKFEKDHSKVFPIPVILS